MSFATKFKKARELRNISAEELAIKLGVSRQTIYDWESGKSEPRKNKLYALEEILQMGSKHHTDSFNNDDHKVIPINKHTNQIPFYDAVAVGGQAMLADQTPVIEPTEMIDPGTWFRSATGALRVYGHSMFPKYPSGCIVAFKVSTSSVIVWGEDYVIELDDRRIVKRVEKGENKDYIKAVSYNINKDQKYVYDPIDIPLSEIKRMYIVLGKIELEASI